MLNNDSITYILFIVLVIAIIIAIILMLVKRIFKFFLFILVLFIAYLGYQYIVNSISPMEFINSIKTDISYLAKSAQDYSKIKKSSDRIKTLIDAKDTSEEALQKIQDESVNLHQIKDEMQNMPHSKILEKYHSLYMLNLNRITATSDSMVFLLQGQKSSESLINNLKEKVNNIFDYIKNKTFDFN